MSGGEVVIVSGPPGSGKSTIAAALAESAERGVHLESDWFLRWIRSGFVPPHLPASRVQNTVVMDVVTDAAAGYAAAGYVVMRDQFADLGDLESHVVVGDGDPADVVARCRVALADDGLVVTADAWLDDRWP